MALQLIEQNRVTKEKLKLTKQIVNQPLLSTKNKI